MGRMGQVLNGLWLFRKKHNGGKKVKKPTKPKVKKPTKPKVKKTTKPKK